MPPHRPIQLKILLMSIGAAFSALALVLFIRRLSVLLRGVAACGRIIDYEARQTNSEGTLDYYPVIEFADAHGTIHRVTATTGSTSNDPEVGILVDVRYLASDPKVAYIQSFLQMWAAPLTCAIAGIGLVAFALSWRE